ncbi:nicalin [Leptidea sinapis]|uniref:nicalin n=1 Tax=Leptidea sinapis TaxID=189913 RepID=UPI002144F235|nr:nicalin [Leptidea sinapis]
MLFDQADGFAEIFKGFLPYYLLVVFPILIIMSPMNPVEASHEFSVYRMQQYDLHTVPHGCRSATFNLEGRSLTSWSTSRHCVVGNIQDITIDQFVEIRKRAGALLLVLPKNDTLLTQEEKEHIYLLEMAMIQEEINIPVYFAKWSPDFDDMIKDLQHSRITDEKSGTALEAMFNTVSSNGYQIVVSAPNPQKLESKAVSFHGKLVGRSGTPTIVVAAHYDASSMIPDLSYGADSNASGAVALLELARIFSRLYSSPSVRGGPTLVFALMSTGHSLNYFTTKKWLEEQLDNADSSLLQDVSFVMCLDSLSSEGLVTHVSKPPKPSTAAHSLHTRLGSARLNHKKINLADELLAWHHERFSIRRMTAFTLSSLQSHKDASRSSILDSPREDALRHLVDNIRTIGRALASHIYNITDEVNDEDAALYDDALSVEETSVKQWYNYLASQSRSPHVVTVANQDAGVNSALELAMSRYMEVTTSVHAVDKREPEYVLYGTTRATLYVYSVKPAVFDLILTLAIGAYLTLVYFAIQVFPQFYTEYAKVVTGKEKVY